MCNFPFDLHPHVLNSSLFPDRSTSIPNSRSSASSFYPKISMIGTLTLPTGTPIRSSQVNRQSLAGAARSGREMLLGGYNPCRTSVHVFAETAPEVDVMKQAGSLYDVLRVRRNASPTEIKTAYRSLAKLYHPDASPSESSEGRDFIEIHNAYATLSDPAARALYDLSLAVGSGRRPFVYSSGQNGPPGFYRTRRWETDQCW